MLWLAPWANTDPVIPALTEMGAIIAPPIPGFYHHPQTVNDLVDSSVDRVLDLIGLPDPRVRRWDGVTR